MEFNVKLNEKQILALIHATDFQSRIEAGQFSDILHKGISISKNVDRKRIRELLDELKLEMFPELESNESYGIYSPNLNENAKILYDIHLAMRYVYSWNKTPEGGMQTWFEEPLKSSKEELPEVTYLEISDILSRAEKDLSMWLYYAGVKSIEEFNQKSEDIKEKSFDKYNDVIEHLTYIDKIKQKLDRGRS